MTRRRRSIAIVRAALGLMLGLAACAPAKSPTVAGDQVAGDEQAGAPPGSMSFIVNFRPSHAMGRAQALQGAGRHDEASQLVRAALRDDALLRGLCFDRFTLGGAEIVLNVCARSASQTPVTQAQWFDQLGAAPSVLYVERNLVATYEHSDTQAHDGAELHG